MITPTTTLCPSARAEEGALLLGVVQPDQTVQLLAEPEPMTPDLTDAISALDAPERQLRFANRCTKSGCNQWQGGRCGVIDLVMAMNRHLPDAYTLPPCSIRAQCRWHLQNGPAACTACRFIVTDTTATDEERLVYVETHMQR